MVVLKTQSEVGHAPPPQTPYSVITNLPGWNVARAIREGDPAPMKRLVHIYPRFMPTHYSAQVSPYRFENNVLMTLALAWA
jgi:cystathionine gamma-synthase